MQIFLCHSSNDKTTVRDLYRRLIKDGFDAWLDEDKLLPGQDWNKEINKAVRESDVVVICLSKNSVTKSGYIQKEIRFALDAAEEKPEGAIFLIPVKVEECIVPERLSRFQWVNLFEANGYDRLLKSLIFAASKKEQSDNIAIDTSSKIQTGIPNISAQTSNEDHQFSQEESQRLTLVLRSTENPELDRKRIRIIYNLLVSYPGKDRFSFQIIENNGSYLIDFLEPTQICEDLLIKLHNIIDQKAPFILEKGIQQ